MSSHSVVSDSVTPWTAAHQAPLSMEFSRQKYWNGLPFLLQGIFPTQESNPGLLHCRQILYHLSHQGRTEHFACFVPFCVPALCVVPGVTRCSVNMCGMNEWMGNSSRFLQPSRNHSVSEVDQSQSKLQTHSCLTQDRCHPGPVLLS